MRSSSGEDVGRLYAFLVSYVIPLALAFGIGAVLLSLSGISPVVAYGSSISDTLGSVYGLSEIFVNATPLILTGLTVALAFRAGFLNIGGEGQFYAGALVAVWVALQANLPSIVFIPLLSAAGFLGGLLWVFIPAVLKLRLGVNEVFTTLMFNFLMILLVSYLIIGPLKAPGIVTFPRTPYIPVTAELARFGGTRLSLGLGIAVLAALASYVLIYKTVFGFRIRAIGASVRAAKYGGIDLSKTLLLVAFISGGMAGLAGMIQVTAIYYSVQDGISPFPIGWGFLGFWVALIARSHPLWVIPAALFQGALIVMGQAIAVDTGASAGIILAIQGLIVLSIIGGQTLLGRRRVGLG